MVVNKFGPPDGLTRSHPVRKGRQRLPKCLHFLVYVKRNSLLRRNRLDLDQEVHIARHTHALAGELRSELVGLGRNLFTPAGNPSSIVSCYHNLDPDGLGSALAREGVRFTFQEEGKLLRLAVGMFNNRDDVDRLLRVIARMV